MSFKSDSDKWLTINALREKARGDREATARLRAEASRYKPAAYGDHHRRLADILAFQAEQGERVADEIEQW